jgi:preprotein translocase subunit YajC
VSFLVLVIIFFGVVWFFFLAPVRRRRAEHAAMQDSVEVGDDVITAGGIHAQVTAVEGDRLQVEIAPRVVVTLDRRAVAAVAREVEVEVDPEPDPEPDPGPGAEAG